MEESLQKKSLRSITLNKTAFTQVQSQGVVKMKFNGQKNFFKSFNASKTATPN